MRLTERSLALKDSPVKAPLTWPNNSLSSRSGGIAAQFSAMKGPALRAPTRWMVRATTSLPVPVSPVINTVASLSATRPMVFCTSRMLLLEPIRSSGTLSVSGWGGFNAFVALDLTMRSSRDAKSARPTGLVR